jgi:hypothetical protein
MDQGCLVPSGWSRSTGTGRCMIGKPGRCVLTARRSTTSICPPLAPSDSALVDGRAQLLAKAALKVAGRRECRRSEAEVWKDDPPG